MARPPVPSHGRLRVVGKVTWASASEADPSPFRVTPGGRGRRRARGQRQRRCSESLRVTARELAPPGRGEPAMILTRSDSELLGTSS